MNTQVLDARRDASGGYRVDVSRRELVGRVSSEWFSCPADERYLSLDELARNVRDRTDRSRTRVVDSALIHVKANRADPERFLLMNRSDATPKQYDVADFEVPPRENPGTKPGLVMPRRKSGRDDRLLA
ncbi:hypothetical protein M2175_001308 [Bradyrhizobium elkanii]|nr:hypothetical protein [Bradyrhizobium elkanii]MCS3966828.1 hypothetical protein [Bradyrhizobium japonicum]